MPTASTIPVILLFFYLWRSTKGQILPCVLFLSVFSAASVVNFGGLGIAPWQFALGAGLFLSLLKGHGKYRFTPGLNRAALHLGIIFIVYAAWSGIAYPLIFHGITVVRTMDPEPLTWTMANFAQLCYLLAAAVVYLLAVSSTRQQLRQAVDWYVRGCVVAAIIALYQLANAVAHVPYPDAIFYSNTGHVVYHAYRINGMWRLNSTFNEASEMAGFLVAALGLMGWNLVTEPLRARRVGAFLITTFAVVCTLSTTGYLCLVYMIVSAAALFAWRSIRSGGISPVKAVVLILLVSGTITLFTLNDTAGPAVGKIVNSTLVDKKNSESFKDRQETHVDALHTLELSYYMGAGWGSVRASGVFYVLIANVGVLGTLIFSVFNLSLFLPLFRPPPSGADTEGHLYEKSLFAITIFSLAMLAAGASPIDPILWTLFGVATVGRAPTLRAQPSWRLAAGARMRAA